MQRWLDGFAERHGAATCAATATVVTLTAADGAIAEVEVPHPPLAGGDLPALVAHATVVRRTGVLLVRLGGYAVGVFEGPRLVSSKVGSRQVHGRSAAGGWSQQRFARRREGQSAVAMQAAADTAVRILGAERLDAVVVGGDRGAVDAVLTDSRLAALRPLVTGRLLDVPDPKLKVLEAAPFRDVWIRVIDPPTG